MEASRQKPMHGSGVCSSFGLFVLEFIELAQDIDWDPDMVVGEPVNGMRVMQQNVRIENIVLDASSGAVLRVGLYAIREPAWPVPGTVRVDLLRSAFGSTATATARAAGRLHGLHRSASTCHDPEPAGNYSSDFLTRVRVASERILFHALLNLKPPNRDIRRIRHRFINIGGHD